MSITKSAPLLVIVAMPTDSAYSMHNVCRPCAFCARVCELVKTQNFQSNARNAYYIVRLLAILIR